MLVQIDSACYSVAAALDCISLFWKKSVFHLTPWLWQKYRLGCKLISAVAEILYFKNACLTGAKITTPIPHSLEELIVF